MASQLKFLILEPALDPREISFPPPGGPGGGGGGGGGGGAGGGGGSAMVYGTIDAIDGVDGDPFPWEGSKLPVTGGEVSHAVERKAKVLLLFNIL